MPLLMLWGQNINNPAIKQQLTRRLTARAFTGAWIKLFYVIPGKLPRAVGFKYLSNGLNRCLFVCK
jgi:hypothetical protein